MANSKNKPDEFSVALSEKDVERLLSEKTPDVRIDVLKKVAEGHAGRKYNAYEFAIAEQILRICVKDTEVTVREALAERLKNNPYVPHDIISALAKDIESVALPILANSKVLTDYDLVTIIRHNNMTKSTAIADRKSISSEVSTALVATRNSEIVSKLAKNPEASIPENLYQEIIRDYGKNVDLMRTISERPHLPVTIMEKVISLVSDSVGGSLRDKLGVSYVSVAADTEKTREVATLKLLDGKHSHHDAEKLVDQLRAFGRLTPSIILTSLCRGNLYFFETSLARLSNIPARNAQLLIHDKGGLGFKALYTKADLPDKFFPACKLLLEVVADAKRGERQLTGGAYANDVVQKLLAKASGKNIDNLSYIIALIRQTA